MMFSHRHELLGTDRGKLATRSLDVAPAIEADCGWDAGALEDIFEGRNPLAR
jgi:hypothetical protein